MTLGSKYEHALVKDLFCKQAADNAAQGIAPGKFQHGILALGMSSVALAALPGTARAQEENDLRTLKKDLFGDRKINTGRVTVTIPPISENGNSLNISKVGKIMLVGQPDQKLADQT